ncbi:hypothetical protein NRB20_51460 [Nocardia sp. RB20]|uniref:Uncharacterized protein n=1 Tax=Nocardia macrotermitis TaxID=2585198 RepID=A0A7K0D8C8_9NOCA|nr:hypothetical protein [Nocardia macrotermitis]
MERVRVSCEHVEAGELGGDRFAFEDVEIRSFDLEPPTI